MKNIRLEYYGTLSAAKPESIVTMPLTMLHVAVDFLPRKVKGILNKEGIDILKCKEFVKEKNLNGELIEVINVNEKLSISFE